MSFLLLVYDEFYASQIGVANAGTKDRCIGSWIQVLENQIMC